MLKKYHLTISVAFWTLITAIIVLFSLPQFLPDFRLPGIFSGISIKTDNESVSVKVPEKEKVYIAQTQYLEVEKKIEWFYFIATGYSANDASQGTGQKTATGKNVFEGIIAVDPKIIPYGTKIEIKGSGYFVAEDCGSKIKGNRLDIYFDSKAEAEEFGKQGVWIRFTDDNSVEIAQITNINTKLTK